VGGGEIHRYARATPGRRGEVHLERGGDLLAHVGAVLPEEVMGTGTGEMMRERERVW